MPCHGVEDPALEERRRSSEGCSSTKSSAGCSRRHKSRPRDGQGKRLRRRGGGLPFCSVLASHIGSQGGVGRQAIFQTPPFQFDWLQQASGTMNNLKHLLCGAMSAVFSKTTTAPLERVKMEMQVHQRTNAVEVARKLYADGGVATFWKGNLMNLIRVAPHKAVNFYSFYVYRTALSNLLGSTNLNAGGTDRFIAGALAGTTATMMCYPLDVIRTRMLSNSGSLYRTAHGTVQAMLRDETLASFYVGCGPAVVSTAASGAIFYGVYDILKSRHTALQQRQGAKEGAAMSAARTMLYGALAGAAAESILYPLEVLRRRMQLQSLQATEILVNAQRAEMMTLAAATERGVFAEAGGKSLPAMHKAAVSAMRKNYLRRALNAAMEIYKMDGPMGFYTGVAPHILQVLPSAALSYYFYEACIRTLHVEAQQS